MGGLQSVCNACSGFADGFGVCSHVWGLQDVCKACLQVWGLQLLLGSAGCLQPELRVCSCILGSAGCLQPELKVWGLQLRFGVLHRVCSVCAGFAAGLGAGGQFGVCGVFAMHDQGLQLHLGSAGCLQPELKVCCLQLLLGFAQSLQCVRRVCKWVWGAGGQFGVCGVFAT